MNVICWLCGLLVFTMNVCSFAEVHSIVSEQEYKALVQDSNKPAVIKFSAQWCGTCKQIKQPFIDTSNDPDFKDIAFYEVDIDKVPSVSKKNNIKAIPTFHYRRNGKRQEETVGVKDIQKFASSLRSAIKQLLLS